MSLLHPDNIDEITKSRTDFLTFKEDLNHAIVGAFPTGRMPYNRVRALLVRWDVDDNTHSDRSVDEIEHLFQEYGFACSKKVISTQSTIINPERCLQNMLLDLGRAGEAGDLTIFYYAGHGIWDERQHFLEIQSGPLQPSSQSSTSVSGPALRVARARFTVQAQANLDISDAAVLYLLDTCHGSAVSFNGNREIFAASSSKLPSDRSWTTELCRQLRSANRRPITVAQLHGKLMKSFAEGRLASTPVHSELSPTMEGSIILAPVTGLTAPYQPDNPDDVRGIPMVLISVQLEDLITDPPSVVEEFKRWLTTHRPSMTDSVKIEVSGYHTSFSGALLLLLTLPVSVWVCLRGDPAYSFVRFVTSRNLDTAPLALAQRPVYQGIENIRPGSSSSSSSSASKPMR